MSESAPPAMVMTTHQEPAAEADAPLRKMPGNPNSIMGVTIASFIYTIAALRAADVNVYDDEYAVAIAVGVISMIVSLVGVFLLRKNPTSFGMQFCAVFLLVLWVIGTGVGTFRGPFNQTGNGYFAAWLNFCLVVYFTYSVVPAFARMCDAMNDAKDAKNKGELIVMVVFIASLVALIEAATLCDKTDDCSNEKGWAVGFSTISTFLTLLLLIPALDDYVDKYKFEISIFLSVIWLPGAGVATFNAPFNTTGNGYFACWVAMISCLQWAYIESAARFPEKFASLDSSVEV